MKTRLILAMLCAALLPQLARADVPVLKTEEAQLNLGGRAQALGFGQQLDDPYRNNARVFLFLKQARVRANGNYQDWTFNAEATLGGEEAVVGSTGVSLSLLDLSVNMPLRFWNKSYIKVGQFKVPYGRERLTYSGDSQFIDRSIQDLGFRVGRDVGATVNLFPGPFTIIAGVFTGGGRDAPQRYLPEILGIPELVARIGIGDVDDDAYALSNEINAKTTKAAFFVNGMYTKDSLVGHSSVLNIKFIDKSILLNPNWNPYISRAPLSRGQFWQVGADAALRTPFAFGASLSAEAELNWASYSNDYGMIHAAGGRAQVGVSYQKFEVALRYAVLFPDKSFSSGGAQITGSQPMHEITPTATWYINGQKLKVVADMPVLIHAPVFTEKGLGSYVSYEQPDQATVIAKGGVNRQTVIEGRVMLQAAF
jgi:hypothetical protein